MGWPDAYVVRVHPGHILGKHDRTGWISLFTEAQQNKLGPAPRGKASFCLASGVAEAHFAAATLKEVAPRYVVATADASYLELFQGIAKRVGSKPVKGTVPGAVIKTVATLGQWQASITGKKPTITPGLAAILTGDLIGTGDLAKKVLNVPSTTLDVMLDEAHSDWAKCAHPPKFGHFVKTQPKETVVLRDGLHDRAHFIWRQCVVAHILQREGESRTLLVRFFWL